MEEIAYDLCTIHPTFTVHDWVTKPIMEEFVARTKSELTRLFILWLGTRRSPAQMS